MNLIALRNRLSCLLALLLILGSVTPAMPMFLESVFATEPSTQVKVYRVTPTAGQPGQDYELLIISDATNCQTTKELSKANLISPQGSPIAVIETKTQAPCALTAKIRIPANAPVGKFDLWVGENNKPPLGTINFSIDDVPPPGQIPRGVAPPAVDVMWSVMPKNVVGDNFGRAISRRFYAIEIIIGNNSAYTLQLVTVGFQLPTDSELQGLVARNAFNRQLRKSDKANASKLRDDLLALRRPTDANSQLINPVPSPTPKRTLLPTSSYKITRGTLESKQATHLRTLVLSTITALGPIFTGFTPYFHNVNHRANYTEFINIFSNPLEKGLELVWPDQRPRQRERFDDQVLRDGLIIRNNTQVRTLAFFPQELLRLPKDVETDSEYESWRNNAREVRERLGEIVIIGDLVQHVNRISLTGNPPGPVAAPPTVVGVLPASLKQGTPSKVIQISGSNFQGAQLSVRGPAGIQIKRFDVDSVGHVITAELSVDPSVPPGTYGLTVSTPSSMGIATVDFVVEPELIEVQEVIYEQKKAGTAVTVPIEIKGKYLHNATIKFASTPANSFTISEVENSGDGRSIRAKVVIPATSTADTYELQIVDPANPEEVNKKEFKLGAPTPPGP